jgi:hypothetical protein
MQGRTTAFVRMVARLRAVRPRDAKQDPASQAASPLLILIATVLACLLAMLEADLNSVLLQSLGLMEDAIDPIFKSP